MQSIVRRKALWLILLAIVITLVGALVAFAAPPPVPILDSATDTQVGGQVKLVWHSTATSTVTYYRVYYQKSGDTTKTQFNGDIAAPTNEATVTNLQNGQNYQFWVKAFNVDGESDFSNLLNATPSDQTDPVTSLNRYPSTPDGNNGWYKSIPGLSFSVLDGSLIQWTKYKWDGVPPDTTYTGGTIPAEEGSHTIYFHSADEYNNTETVKNYNLKVDNVVPVSTVTSSTSGSGWNSWYKNGDTLPETTITATDATSGVVSIFRAWTDTTATPSSWTETTFTAGSPREVTISASSLAEGTKYLWHKALDEAGNEETPSATQYKIDTVVPGAVPTPTVAAKANGDALVSWSSVDDTSSGIYGYNVWRSDPGTITGSSVVATVTSGTSWLDTETTNTNTYYYQVSAIDNAGNFGPAGGQAAVDVDDVPPTIDLTSTPVIQTPVTWLNTNYDITLTAADVGLGLQAQYYRWDSGSWTSNATSTVTLTSMEGSHTLSFYALDNVDNTSTPYPKTQQFLVDLTDPSSGNVFTPDPDGPNGSWVSTPTATITATDTPGGLANMASGVSGIWYRWDTATTMTLAGASVVATQPSTPGTRTITWYSVDNAGNREATQTATLVWDPTMPTITQTLIPTEPASGWYDLASVDVRNEATSSVGTTITSISYKWNDESTWTVAPGAVATVTASAEGSRTLSAYAIDENGKISVTRDKTVRIDRTDPVISDLLPSGSVAATRTPTIGATITDPLSGVNWSTLVMKLDGVTVTPSVNPTTGAVTYTPPGWLNQGEHTVYLEVHDNAGSTSNVASTTFAFNIDTSAPFNTSVVINGGASTTNDINVTLTLSAADVYTSVTEMAISNNGTDWSAWVPYATSSAATLTAGADGSRTMYAKFRDAAGNASDPVSDSIVLDTGAAAPTGLSALAGNAQVSLVWNAASDVSGVSGYQVWRGTSSGAETLLTTVGSPFFVDSLLANGTTYFYFVRTVDELGNVSGNSAEVSAKPQKPSSISIGASPSTINYGSSSTLSGEVVDNPGADVTVTIEKKDFGSAVWVVDQTTTTDGDGVYSATVSPTKQTNYRASWPGNSGTPATSGVIMVQVRSKVTIGRSRFLVRRGRRVRIFGAVLPNHAGETVIIQIRSRGVWRNWRTVLLNGASAYSFYWRPRYAGRFYFRAFKPAATGNVAGTSSYVGIRVL